MKVASLHPQSKTFNDEGCALRHHDHDLAEMIICVTGFCNFVKHKSSQNETKH